MAQTEEFTNRNPTFQTINDAYLLPNDQPERQRLISQHKSFQILAGGTLLHIPADRLGSPRKIIDVGCGTGIVTRELAAAFPDAEHVYGVDLTAVTPDDAEDAGTNHKLSGKEKSDSLAKISSSNLEFIQGDIMHLAGTPSAFAWETFDLLYSRLLVCGMTNWPGYVERAFRLLRRGGWAEMGELCEDVYFDPSITADPPRPAGFVAHRDWEWLRVLREGGRRKGLDVDAGQNVAGYMRAAGFVEVRTREFVIPYWRAGLEERPEAEGCFRDQVGDPWAFWWHKIPRMVEGMGYEPEQIKKWQEDSKRDLGEEPGKYRVFCITVGRKPEASES